MRNDPLWRFAVLPAKRDSSVSGLYVGISNNASVPEGSAHRRASVERDGETEPLLAGFLHIVASSAPVCHVHCLIQIPQGIGTRFEFAGRGTQRPRGV